MDIINYMDWKLFSISSMEAPEKHLLRADELLKGLGVPYYLGFGTVLGFYRDGDFIPNDTDIDINILDYSKINEIMLAFNKEWTLIRSVEFDNKYQQLAYQADDGMIIDLCFYERDGRLYRTRHEEGSFVDSVDVVGVCTPFKTKYGYFPFPDHIEFYLKDHYGDWKTPREAKSLTY